LTFLTGMNGFLLKGAEWITIAAMTVIAIVIPHEVFGRYLLGETPAWSGEVATYSLVWLTMMGSAAGLRRGYQVSIDIAILRLPAGISRMIRASAYFFLIFFFFVMTGYGFAQTWVNLRQMSPALGIPMALPYLALPAGFTVMLFFTLEEWAALAGRGPQGRPPC
jgi:TRAP-type C4-dicarboxylate transport system permease small subunit